jgi:hypothetical protein
MDTFNEDVELFTKERKGDDRLGVRFFRKAVRDDVASAEQGRMVFKELDYVQIMVPGDRDNIIVRPAGEGDKRRFGQQYADWKRNEQSEQLVGTPLEMWGRLNLSQIEEFRYIGVRTVEQLAVLKDDAMLRFPGASDLKRKAQTYLDAQKDEAPMRALQAALEARDADNAQMREQLAKLAAQVERQSELIAAAESKKERARAAA